jgi:undecaprenyl-diphosphatase
MPGEADLALALAHTAGAHALGAFGVLLVLLLVAVLLLWRAHGRWGVPHATSRLPPAAFLLLRLVVGFGLVVGAAALFAELAEGLGAHRTMGLVDTAFTAALGQSVPLPALQLFASITQLGNPLTVIVICVVVAAALLWRRRRWLALAWVIAVAGNSLLNVTLKSVFARVRPPHADGLVAASGYSFPSGHASGSVVLYGMLAYLAVRLLPRPWPLPIVLAATAVAFATGSSRVFLRVHYASDVLAGFASGTAWLVVCIVSIETTRWYRRRRE